MMCHSTGRPPISTIGFGFVSVSSRSRVPGPPHRITTFGWLVMVLSLSTGAGRRLEQRLKEARLHRALARVHRTPVRGNGIIILRQGDAVEGNRRLLPLFQVDVTAREALDLLEVILNLLRPHFVEG